MEAHEYEATENGETIQCKFFIKRDFLPHADCDELIRYYQEVDRKNCEEGFFAKRLIWFSRVPESANAKNIMRKSRIETIKLIQQFYGLDYPIYADSIQLVSWQEGQSMPAHYDNRHPSKMEPHPTPWREYAGVIYLNDNYADGELFLSSPDPHIVLKPEKGMLLVFGGGDGFMHGVRAPYGATRYTMPCWFTRDKAQEEKDYSMY